MKYIFYILLPFAIMLLVSCEPKEKRFFMRYQTDNPGMLASTINNQLNELAQTKDAHDAFIKSLDLSENLTIAGREKEAIKLLQPYIDQQDVMMTAEDKAWLFLNYATARQYDNNGPVAEQYFKKALAIAEKENLEAVQHYILHHYGRFLAEKKEYPLAKKHFEEALVLRKKLSDNRSINTQRAIDTLNLLLNVEQ